MNIAFRVDVSRQIGIGHVMRCLTLADKLKEMGIKISFISRNTKEGIVDKIIYPYDLFTLPFIDNKNIQEWTKNNWEIDCQESIEIVKLQSIDLLIMDHYSLDYKWEEKMKPYVDKIMVIDDLADRKHSCDILLDSTYGIDADKYKGLINKDAIILCGGKYALLRKEFREHVKKSWLYNENKIRFHLFFGGTDYPNFTYRYAKLLLEHFDNIELIVIVGSGYLYIEKLQELKVQYQNKINIYQNIINMASYLKKSDIALGAPGTATWERACVGIPAVYLANNQNQIEILQHLAKQNLCIYLGEASTLEDEYFVCVMREILKNKNHLELLHKTSKQAIDGLGTIRVMQQIIQCFSGGEKV